MVDEEVHLLLEGLLDLYRSTALELEAPRHRVLGHDAARLEVLVNIVLAILQKSEERIIVVESKLAGGRIVTVRGFH